MGAPIIKHSDYAGFIISVKIIRQFLTAGLLIILCISCSESAVIPPGPTPEERAEKYFSVGNEYSHKGDYLKAIEMYQKSADLVKKAVYFYNIGLAYQKMTVYEKAVESYQQVLDIQPRYPEALYNMALCYDKMNRIEDAQASYLKYKEMIQKPAAADK